MASREFEDRDRYTARRALLLWLSLSGIAWGLWVCLAALAWRL